MVYVLMYLLAIVCANLSVAWFGPQLVVVNTFVFIGFDLTARDALHDAWHGRHLRRKMLMLIAGGSVLSAALSTAAVRVSIASFVAFAAAGLMDTVIYERLFHRAPLLRMNASNLGAAVVDSAIFVSLAFGTPILVDVIIVSSVAKIVGGFGWSVVIDVASRQRRISDRQAV